MQCFSQLKKFTVTLGLLGLSACSVVDLAEDVQYSTVTQPVSAQALQDIQPGKTNSRWLLNNIGRASEQEAHGERRVIWRYDLNETRRRKTQVALLYRKHSHIKTRCQLSMLLSDDVVIAMWSGNSADTLAKVAENFSLKLKTPAEPLPMCEQFAYIQ
ncbi:MAG: hypothetical protein OIF35_02990 [Cellvibrionaceae bacterium]|nr:hypothetical protein [Cellvibrionaceae bacterium]